MRGIVRMFLGMMLTATAAAPLAAQAGTIRGTISDSAGPGLANAAVTVEGTDAPGRLGDRGRLRDPGRARRHSHGESATDRLPLASRPR